MFLKNIIIMLFDILRKMFIHIFNVTESIDGSFSNWSNWTVCPVSCGGGNQTRNRSCSNPEPQNGGSDCVGDLEETQACNTDTCPLGNNP